MRDSMRQLTLTRFREFVREPEALFWSLLFPILLSVGLGIAFRNRPAEVVHVAVVGEPAAASRTLVALRQSRAVAPESLSADAARVALRTGRVALVVRAGPNGAVTYEFDDTRPDSRDARFLADDAIQRAAGRADRVAFTEQHVRDRGSRYIDFVVPGLLGLGLMGNGIWAIGFAIVDARRKKLLKRFMATPMSRAEYLGSFLVSRFTLLVIEVLLLVGFAALVFDVPVRGSLWTLVLICCLGALAFCALGLLVAARPRTIEGAPGRRAAVHPGAAADRGERRFAGEHAARGRPRCGRPRDRHHPRMDDRLLLSFPAPFPLALIRPISAAAAVPGTRRAFSSS
jgi:hypothetical protein